MNTSALTPASVMIWPFNGYSDEINRDIKWYSSWISCHLNQGGTGLLLAAFEFIPLTLLCFPILNVITHIALATLFPNKQESFKNCLEQENALGAYVMIEQGGIANDIRNSKRQTVLDLLVAQAKRNGIFYAEDLRICEKLLKDNATADFSQKGFQLLLEAALKYQKDDLAILLMNNGVEASDYHQFAYSRKNEALCTGHPAFSTFGKTYFSDPFLNRTNISGSTSLQLPEIPTTEKAVKKWIQRRHFIIYGESESTRLHFIRALALQIHQKNPKIIPLCLRNKSIIGIDLEDFKLTSPEWYLKSVIQSLSNALKKNPNVICYIHGFEIFGNYYGETAHKLSHYLLTLMKTRQVLLSMPQKCYEELFSTNHLFLLDALEIKSWTKEEMIKWLTFQKLRLERDFRISISDEAFKAVVEIKNEPKQAAKLLEEASMEVLDQEDEGSFRLQDLKRKYPESSTKIKKLEASDQEELKSLFRYRQLKAKIKLLERFNSLLPREALRKAKVELEALNNLKRTSNIKFEVDAECIQRVSDPHRNESHLTDLPLKSIPNEVLNNLEQNLSYRIIGQKHAIQLVSNAILPSAIGIDRREGPFSVLLFAGPTGIGKTELAKQLAVCLELPFKQLDFSGYYDKHQASGLTGTSPGYVGYGDGGQLTNWLKTYRQSVVLLDEVEKADPFFLKYLLLPESMTANNDMKNPPLPLDGTIIVMTTNLGSEELEKLHGKNGSYNAKEIKTIVLDAMKKSGHFPPEVIGRIHEIIPFLSLTKEEKVEIIQKELVERQVKIKAVKSITFTWTPSLVEALSNEGESVYGVRNFKNVIRQKILSPLAKLIVESKLGHDDSINIDHNREAYVFNVVKADPEPSTSSTSD